MATLYIDNRPYEFQEGQNLLHTCLALGFDIPFFCWHPAMHSVGACRQCAVKLYKDEKDSRGTIVMSCMTPARHGTRISIDDPEVREFRRAVIEFLMANHPHDCPVCDEGGECHLQDMTVMTGHVYRRHRFPKRTHRNQDLGPFITHEMNRCIACYRCVRFYRDLAGGTDLDVFAWHDAVYFGRQADGPLESEFSGNLVEICPTGVFTDKTLARHYTRKWDLQTAPSLCVHCGVGCNTIAGERYGMLRRIRNRFNHEVNGYFLCDRGRFGYEFVDGSGRLRTPLLLAGQSAQNPAERDAALQAALNRLRQSRGVIGIGSPRASLETNFALLSLVGPERFFGGVPAHEHRLMQTIAAGPVPTASLAEVQQADAVLILGEDLINTAPMLGFSVRQALFLSQRGSARPLHIEPWLDTAVRTVVQGAHAPLLIGHSAATRLDAEASELFRAAPDDLARFGLALAQRLDDSRAMPEGLAQAQAQQAQRWAETLARASRPLVVAGTSLGSLALVQAALAVAAALSKKNPAVRQSLVVPHCNSLGLACLGGGDLDGARRMLASGAADTLLIVENDPFRSLEPRAAAGLLDTATTVIAIDHCRSPATDKAHIVLPAATFAESSGTLVNYEGRPQRFFTVLPPAAPIQASWRWLGELSPALAQTDARPWATLDELLESLVRYDPIFRPAAAAAPGEDFRLVDQKVPRQPVRYSGRTAMHAARHVAEERPPQDPDTPLSFSMEGAPLRPPPPLLPRYWSPGLNSVQALLRYQRQPGGPLQGAAASERLFAPGQTGRTEPEIKPPPAYRAEPGRFAVVPLYHLFGSEELSSRSAAIASRGPEGYVSLNPADARRLDLSEGTSVAVTSGVSAWRLRLRLDSCLPAGLAGVPQGLAATAGLEPGQNVGIRREDGHE